MAASADRKARDLQERRDHLILPIRIGRVRADEKQALSAVIAEEWFCGARLRRS
jgi:hypothetical protein